MDEQVKDLIEFAPSAARRSRILRLWESAHQEYPVWRTCMLYGGWISVLAGVFGVPLFGLWWRRETWMWAVTAVSGILGLLVLAAGAFLMLTGRLTGWILVEGERLTLGETELVFRVTRANWRFWQRMPGETYIWTMPYEAISRIDYERGTKCLRVYGHFRESDCLRPSSKGMRLPKGMTEVPSERKTDRETYLDIPLYYDDSVELLQTLETRTQAFIRPAMRGDDYADLRDLPGLKPRWPVFRGLALFLAVMGLSSLLIAGGLRREGGQAWQPFPLTAEEVLTGQFSVGGSAVLDGCRVTLEKASPSGNGGLNVTLLFENLNESLPVLLHLGKQQSNVIARAQSAVSESTCNYIPPDNPLVQLAPGGAYHYDVVYQIPVNARSVVLEVNSDRWAANTHFWEPEYLGRTVVIGGVEYLHNRVFFTVHLS